MVRARRTLHLLQPLIVCLILIYALTHCASMKLQSNTGELAGHSRIVVNFFFPMRQDSLSEKISIIPEMPSTQVSCDVKWLNATTAVLEVQQQGYLQGQLLTVKIDNAPTVIPLLNKSVGGKVRPLVPVELIIQEDAGLIPSRGPVPVVFNTPIDPQSLKKAAIVPSAGYKYEFTFTTVEMGQKIWVDVKLGQVQTMTVYKGSKVIRQMLASGGRQDTPTPLGYFYAQDRGYSFFSPRFGEGATYWIRLVDQILVHSVPRDSQWRIKEEEHEKLGLPASHGCIRLAEKDAKWFYENIPRGTMVIIHK